MSRVCWTLLCVFFLENEDVWIGEDENKITKLVNTFFVKTAFSNFANRTITAFLMDKYGITNNAQLADKNLC